MSFKQELHNIVTEAYNAAADIEELIAEMLSKVEDLMLLRKPADDACAEVPAETPAQDVPATAEPESPNAPDAETRPATDGAADASTENPAVPVDDDNHEMPAV